MPARIRATEKVSSDLRKAHERAQDSGDLHRALESLDKAVASKSRQGFEITSTKKGKKIKMLKSDKGSKTKVSLAGEYIGAGGKGSVSRKQNDEHEDDSGDDSEIKFKIKYNGRRCSSSSSD